MSDITTFKHLFELLKLLDQDLTIWLNKPWKGKDKQESILRLFSKLGLIEKLNSYHICTGNFNLKTIRPITRIKDIFYDENGPIKLKDKGDSSDLTGIHKNDDKNILVTTSKNITKMTVGNLDIDKILTNWKQYQSDHTMTLCFCIRSLNDFEEMKERIESTNKELKIFLNKDNIIIDWNDLQQAFNQFRIIYKDVIIDSLFDSNKKPLCLKMHQTMSIIKTMELKKTKERILWGHIQRSGKSYIIGGCIIEDSRHKDKCNYLVITTAPNETIRQQLEVFYCIQLQDFGIIPLNGDNKKPLLKDKNIIVCSKQFLQTKIDSDEKTTNIPWLKKMEFDIRFIDESHNGGTTSLAKKTLDFYGKNVFTVQITATYSKPCNDFGIQRDSWILWDLEDIQLCKSIDKPRSIHRLVEKHGNQIQDIIGNYSIENIISEYSKYPELWIMTHRLKPDVISEIIRKTADNYYGFSTEACFLLKQARNEDGTIQYGDKFQNEKEMLKLFYKIFGKRDRFGIPDSEFPDEDVFMKRIERVCKNPLTKSRFIGDTCEPMIIMAFLPPNNIDKISIASKDLLIANNVIPEYHIICINSNTTSDPKNTIEEGRIFAKNSHKKGVLVFSGRQCSLGVSIHNCDIVLLLNNSSSFDMIYQMMFRCMTEGDGKKCGFVVDLNIHRVIETSMITYASLIKPSDHPRDAVRHILQERIINLNGDDWMTSFGNGTSKMNELCNSIYNIYSSNTEKALQHFIERLHFKEVILSTDEQKLFNIIFGNSNITQKQIKTIQRLLDDSDEDVNVRVGIEPIRNPVIEEGSESDNSDESNSPEPVNNKINFMNILKHIIPLICILTIHNEETSFIEMFNYIELHPAHYQILIDQTKSWWSNSIDSLIIKKFISVYIKYMSNDTETNQIIRTIKELFMKNITNMKELSSLIDKYFIPQELETKKNAEVSTPHKLRQEMLDTVPLEFWTSPKRVFEPCAGKGGFLIDIIDRFMIGLSSMIPNEKHRYKVIVEECLYFSDINPTNIFICKLLIDPYNEYLLHWNEGNTLELNIQEKWGIDGFHAGIGNPPYQEVSEDGVSKGGGNNLYTKFVYYMDQNLLENGYILFINPPTYFSSGRSNNKNEMNLRRDVFDKYYYHYINLEECSKYFNVGSKFIYYLIQKNSNKNSSLKIICKYNKKIYESILHQNLLIRKYLPYLITNNCLNILDKVKTNDCPKLNIFNSTYFDKRRPHVLNKNKNETDEIYKRRAIENGYIYPIQATSIQVVYSSNPCKNQYNKKVLMSESGYLKPFYDNGILGVGGHCFACIVSNTQEGDNIIKLLNSKLYKFYIETNKWSGFHNKDVLQDLPNILSDIDIIDDIHIYEYFNLTLDEIKLINL